MKYFWLIAGGVGWLDEWNAIVRARNLDDAVDMMTKGTAHFFTSVVASKEIHESYAEPLDKEDQRETALIVEMF